MKDAIRQLTLIYLKTLATLQLRKCSPEVIAITGSAGKTSCRQAVSLLLSSGYKIHSTAGGLNSEWGVPLAILEQESGYNSPVLWAKSLLGGLRKLLTDWGKYDFFIAELGVDKPNDMEYLLSFIHPTVGVVLNILPVHTEQFSSLGARSLENIAAEKGKLIADLPSDGEAILNFDDPEVSKMALVSRAHITSFGLNPESDLWADAVEVGEFGFRMMVHHEGRSYAFSSNQWLTHRYAYTFLAALAVGTVRGINLDRGIKILANNYILPPGRMHRFVGVCGTTLIDSSYNASTTPMLAALDFLGTFSDRIKIAALGDMRELGPLAQEEHEKVAARAVQTADSIVTVGPLMEKYLRSKALSLGFPPEKITSFKSSVEAGEFIKKKLIKGGEVILAKGSQNTIFMERLVEVLLDNLEEDRSKLCRRGKYWDQLRDKNF